MNSSKILLFVASLSFFHLSNAAAKASEDITATISPNGSVESVEQIQVQFSKAMIRIGDHSKAAPPIESDCLKNGDGYWIDEKNWVFTFREAPEANVTCKMSTIKDLKSYDGKPVAPGTSEFKTLQAQVLRIAPSEYQDIDQNQIFLVTLNGVPDPQWIKENVYFTLAGLGEKIPAILLDEKKKQQVLKETRKAKVSRYADYEEAEDNYTDQVHGKMDTKDAFIAALQPGRTFPRGYKIELHWLQDYPFTVQKAFKVEFTCERESAGSSCIPLGNLNLVFSDLISGSEIDKIYLLTQQGDKIYPEQKATLNPKATFDSLSFKGPFLPRAQYQIIIGKSFQSAAKEKLSNAEAFPLKFQTDDLPSLFKVDREFSVIESSNPVLPVTIRNVENPIPAQSLATAYPLIRATTILNSSNVNKVIELLKSVGEVEREKPMSPLADFKPVDLKVAKAHPNGNTEIIGVPLTGKGLHFTEFKSRILGQKINYQPGEHPDYYVRTLSLVTDIGLTMKASPTDVVVWALSLDKGTPVANASAFLYTNMGEKIKGARTDENGVAHFKLNAEEAEKLNKRIPGYYGHYYDGFFCFVQKDDDYSFLFSGDTQGLESYRFSINLPYKDPEVIYHAVLEKNLLRPGEIVKAKLIYRKLEPVGLSIPKIDLPKKIQLKSLSSKNKYLAKVKWDLQNGTGTFEWKIPGEATLGNYAISSPDKNSKDSDDNESGEVDEADAGYNRYNSYDPSRITFGSFSVEEFKVPNINAQLSGVNLPWVNAKSHKIDFTARYFSGGPAAKLPIKIRYSQSSSSWSPTDDDYSDFTWQAGEVKEGVTKYFGNRAPTEKHQENQVDMKLDDFGVAQIDLKGLHYTNEPQSAVVSVEYQDANGDIQTISRGYPMYTSKLMLGIRGTTWYQTSKAFEFEAAVLDLKSKPVAGRNVNISLFKVDNYSTRKKILGGFYSYENFTDIQKVKDLCSGKTNEEGRLLCKGSDENLAGEYLIAASVKDDNGNTIYTKTSAFLSGGTYWYGGGDSDRMDLIPNKKSFEPGETAEFQVRGPITEGQLLVTVERNGIISQSTQKFDSKNPTFKVKISEDWAPNVVISAVLVRGRVDGKVTGLLDLGKPSLKMGMTSVRVGIKKHVLKVLVKTDKENFQPRETVNVDVEITDSQGKPVNGEIALAAVDEGLLALKTNNTWDLLGTMMPLRAHNVKTSYLISHVLGKRTLGLKAVPSGGDGAGNAARELFDTSLFWNPRVVVKNGKAKVSFKANDSLTSFKVVAIALAGADKFGTGSTSIKITKDIQSYPSLALAVRNGDNYFARFSIRNSSKNAADLQAELTLNKIPLSSKSFNLDTNKSTELSWPVSADATMTQQNFELKVTQNSKTVDLLKFKQPIQQVWAMRSFGSSFKQTAELRVPVIQDPGSTRSEVLISAIPTLAAENPGIKRFWELYPFDCFEQRLSKAISLNSEELFENLMKVSESYMDSSGFVKFYPSSMYGDIFLTNYVLQISKLKGWHLKAEFEEKALEATRQFFDGRLVPYFYFAMEPKYKELLRLESLDSLSLYGKAKASEFSSLDLKMEMLGNNYLAHAISILSGPSAGAKESELLKQALQILRSRTVASSKGLSLKDAVSERMYGMFVYDDVSFAKLLIQVIRKPEFKDDAGKLILSFIDSQKGGSWYNTMANAWANVAMQTYKETFEKDPVVGEIKWGLNKDSKSLKIDNDSHKAVFPLEGKGDAFADFKGKGLPWWTVLVSANTPVSEDINHGISVEKTWKPIQVKDAAKKSVGDVWEITLKIRTKSEFQWLAVRDPIPPGGTVVTEDGAAISEKKALEYRIYETWFGNNEHVYVYQLRLNQPGKFNLPTTRAEAMYDPDIHGEKVNGQFVITE